jgi:hypothetical protein
MFKSFNVKDYIARHKENTNDAPFREMFVKKSGEIKILAFRHYVGLEVLTAVVMKSSVFWDYNTV